MRRLLAALAVLAALAAFWLAADAWRESRIPRSGRPLTAPQAADRPPPAPVEPDTAASATARLTIAWQDPTGQQYRSEITLEPDATAPTAALVVTRDRQSGQELVRYRTRAVRIGGGTLLLDAEGAAVSGPLASDWSPDSFSIAKDGQVITQDAHNSPGEGLVVQEDAFIPER